MPIDEELSRKTIWVYSNFDAENDPTRRWNTDEGSARDVVTQSIVAIAGPHVQLLLAWALFLTTFFEPLYP